MRAADLLIRGGGTVTAGSAVPSAGELAVFCRPVVTAPAVTRRDGTVLADAWLPDLVRLGELERHLGDGVIEAIVDAALEKGRLRKRQRRRIMSYPLVIRLMIAMTLMPDGSCCESLARLAGLLADVPFALGWHVPTGKVVTGWRLLIPAGVMEDPVLAGGPRRCTPRGLWTMRSSGQPRRASSTAGKLPGQLAGGQPRPMRRWVLPVPLSPSRNGFGPGHTCSASERLSDQMNDNRHRQRWTPVDTHGRSVADQI